VLRFLPERERPIHLSQFPVLAAMPKRFCNDCETSELFGLGSILLYLRLHGTYSGRPVQRLTCRCEPLFRAASRISASRQLWGMGRVGHPQPARFADDKSRPAAGSGGSGPSAEKRASRRTALLPGARAHRLSVGRQAQHRGCVNHRSRAAERHSITSSARISNEKRHIL
jgi:hypothetical protein